MHLNDMNCRNDFRCQTPLAFLMFLMKLAVGGQNTAVSDSCRMANLHVPARANMTHHFLVVQSMPLTFNIYRLQP